MKLTTCIHQFFNQYLIHIKGLSPQTIKAYGDTYEIFLPFVAKQHGIEIASLKIDHLTDDVILAFLNHLESDRNNTTRTRNLRLAAIKSFAKMIQSTHPQKRQLTKHILNIPQKRFQKHQVGYLYPKEIFKIYDVIDFNKKEGFRDYCLLHLLYDSAARVSEIAGLNLDHFDASHRKLSILGKGSHNRLIKLWSKTAELLKIYIAQYRTVPGPLYRHRLFINQRRQAFTRYGIYRICQKYLKLALEPRRFEKMNSASSFRHSRAINMLVCGESLSVVKNRLGHESIQSTMVYLHNDLNLRRARQKELIEYAHSPISSDPNIAKFNE